MLPLSLYIHIPWCIQKCPYCDFNSHKSGDILPEDAYIQALLSDLDQDLSYLQHRQISSIFIGGGTPSLFNAHSYELLFSGLAKRLSIDALCEITLEANPGTVDYARFRDYRSIGINRLSLGIQSFNPIHLKTLGRIHDDQQAHLAIQKARDAGFDNLNLDIMHGLPHQSIDEGLADLKTAISYAPEHLSWYQLTLEPNTVFYKMNPPLPSEDDAEILEQAGFNLLKQHDYNRYEISAFCKNNQTSEHNLNYWRFGDYIGIGAGAHGKFTLRHEKKIIRTRKHRMPQAYLKQEKKLAGMETLTPADQIFEFMLNTTRLEEKIAFTLFEESTFLSLNQLFPLLKKAENIGLLTLENKHWKITPQGRRYTNDLQALFL